MIVCSQPECQTTAGCKCGQISIPWPADLIAGLNARIESDAKRIAELERKHFDADDKRCYWQNRAEAAERELDTANANHRDMASRLKDMGTQLEQARSALAEERERCALLADDYLCPDNQTEDYSSGFIDACIFIATAIRSGKPDGKDPATLTKGSDQ